MTLLSGTQQTELEKPVTRTVYFLEFEFSTATSRLSTFNQTITWGGYDWSGLGQILNISQVDEEESPESKGISISIVAAETSWLALAVGPVEEYRGRAARMYMCPLDKNFVLVGTPVLAWTGIMDAASINIDEGGEGGVNIKCETAAYALKRRPIWRINAEQHKSRYPADTSFDYLKDLIGNPQLWLSKKFQSR